MTTYAIKINDKFLKDFIYYDFKNTRFSGHSQNGIFVDGDIIDLELTDKILETYSKRTLADKIRCIYSIDKYKKSCVSIIPVNNLK